MEPGIFKIEVKNELWWKLRKNHMKKEKVTIFDSKNYLLA